MLDFGQARRKVLAGAEEQALEASGQNHTVRDAVADYIDWMNRHSKSAAATEVMLNAYVLSFAIAVDGAAPFERLTAGSDLPHLCHTYASHLVQAGIPLMFLAETLGHADTRMAARHYGHIAPPHVAAAIRAALPKFGHNAQTNVTDMRKRKA